MCNRNRIAIVTLIAAVVVGFCAFFYWKQFRAANLASRAERFEICLHELLLAENRELPMLHDINGQGIPTVSWRFRRLLEQMPVPRNGADFSKTWTDPVHSHFREMVPPFLCFSAIPNTSIVAVSGKGTAFDVPRMKIDKIPTDTILIVEVNQRRIHWMAPGDIDIDGLVEKVDSEAIRPSSDYSDGFFVGFADGAVWRLRSAVPLELLFEFCRVSTAAEKSRDELLGKYVMLRRQPAPYPYPAQ